MNGTIVYVIDHLAPFDIPTENQKNRFISGEDSVHASSLIMYSEDNECNYASKEFGIYLDLIKERGAIRGIDYIVTVHNSIVGWYVTIHTTNKYITKEDGDGMVYIQ